MFLAGGHAIGDLWDAGGDLEEMVERAKTAVHKDAYDENRS